MKKSTVLLLVMVSINTGLKAQQETQLTTFSNFTNLKMSRSLIYALSDTPAIVKDQAYYKQKSKSLRTVGLGFLGAGVLLSGIGLLVIGNNDIASDDSSMGLAIMGLGAIAGIISIPLMVTAHVNGHKARVLLKNQKTGFGVPLNVSRDITGITMVIPISK